MFLAEPRGRVTVLLQDGANGAVRLHNDRVVARIPRGNFPHDAKAGDVMVAAGDQGRARRRAERRGVEIRVTQPGLRDAIQRRRRDDAAERARRTEAAIVGHDEQHIGRALRRHDARRPPRFRLRGLVFDHAAEFRIRGRKLFSADGGGGAGRTRYVGGLDLSRDGSLAGCAWAGTALGVAARFGRLRRTGNDAADHR